MGPNSGQNGPEHLVGHFTCADYIVFSAMLATTGGIGIYYGVFQKMSGKAGFFVASRSMGTFPVALSLIASFASAITMIGTTTEIYHNGFEFWLFRSNWFLVAPTAAYVFLPVFWKLEVSSSYQYLKIRFNDAVQKLGSTLFLFQMTISIAIVVYAPSLALSQVTGVSLLTCVCAVFSVCLFYTALGGIKAVLWNNVLQIMVMVGSMLMVLIKGIIDIGGLEEVWNKASEGNRTNFASWGYDPRERHNFWSLFVGGFFINATVFCVSQEQVQRYLCLKTKRKADCAIWIGSFGFFAVALLSCFTGLVLYAKYADCDPISSNLVTKPDQMLPLLAMSSLGHIPGLNGIFVAGIFSGALSSASSGINALAMIAMEDFIHSKYGCKKMDEKVETIISKGVTLVFGLLIFYLVFLVQEMGDILIVREILISLIGGPTLGLFTLGMFVPFCNSLGAFAGTLISLSFVLWVVVGNVVATSKGHLAQEILPVKPCNFSTNVSGHHHGFGTTLAPPLSHEDPLLEVYKLSYLWYSSCGILGTIIAGTLISILTGNRDIHTLNPDVISPLVFKLQKIFPSISEIGILYNKVDTKQERKISSESSESSEQLTKL